MSFAVYALFALVVVTTSASASVCVEKVFGVAVGFSHEAQVEYLAPSRTNYNIPLNNPCSLMRSGVRVTVCEADGQPAPTLVLPSMDMASVTRHAYPWRDAVLTATVYCLVGGVREHQSYWPHQGAAFNARQYNPVKFTGADEHPL